MRTSPLLAKNGSWRSMATSYVSVLGKKLSGFLADCFQAFALMAGLDPAMTQLRRKKADGVREVASKRLQSRRFLRLLLASKP
jgi:hypothetical protein